MLRFLYLQGKDTAGPYWGYRPVKVEDAQIDRPQIIIGHFSVKWCNQEIQINAFYSMMLSNLKEHFTLGLGDWEEYIGYRR